MNSFSKTMPWWFTEQVIRAHLEKVAPRISGRLLDIGCGRKRYRDLFQTEQYVGIELGPTGSADVQTDARQLPFASESFDCVLSNQVLEHVDDPGRVVAEACRVLRPGGLIVVTVPFIGRVHGEPHDYWRFSEFGLRRLLSEQGFEPQTVLPMGGFVTTQCFLWAFWIWEKLTRGGYRWTRAARLVLAKGLMRVLNPIMWALHRRDRDTRTPFNYLAVGVKR